MDKIVVYNGHKTKLRHNMKMAIGPISISICDDISTGDGIVTKQMFQVKNYLSPFLILFITIKCLDEY